MTKAQANTPKVSSFAAYPQDLLSMFHYMRPHFSWVERTFCREFLAPLGAECDYFGNWTLRIGDTPVLWSCHTDTVHDIPGAQHLRISGKGLLGLSRKEPTASCLGGDDTAGVWLMVQMAKHKVPGLYVWHAGEEVGCVGSRWIARQNSQFLDGIKAAIALDRRGRTSIITRQRGTRCCSDEFGESLAKALGGEFRLDPTGLYTDTANYTDHIGECTNISVGYERSHTGDETQDLPFLIDLSHRLIHLDTSQLVFKRQPGEVERFSYGPATQRVAANVVPKPRGFRITNGRIVYYGRTIDEAKRSNENFAQWQNRLRAIHDAEDGLGARVAMVADAAAAFGTVPEDPAFRDWMERVGPLPDDTKAAPATIPTRGDLVPISRGGSQGGQRTYGDRTVPPALPTTKPRGFLDADREEAPPTVAKDDEPVLTVRKVSLETLCETYPHVAADLLEQLGVDSDEFVDHLLLSGAASGV